MKLYSYVIRSDSGFAPNPFYGFCTLATCKPVIRKTCKAGDWIIGTGSVEEGRPGKLVYAMKVDEVIPLEIYGSNEKFTKKIPVIDGTPEQRCGDNIYFIDKKGKWIQRPGRHQKEHIKRDLKGKNALIAREFYYFGKDNEVEFPEEFNIFINKTQGHKCNFPREPVEKFITWIRDNFKPGRHGFPLRFSRKKGKCC
ncbi:hypothetical protein ACFL35_16210 [Candidatus Riflebacteria bacterium]